MPVNNVGTGKNIQAQLLDALTDNITLSYRVANTPYNYTLEDVNGNRVNILPASSREKKIVFRYSELNCNICIDSAFARFSAFADRIGDSSAVILVESISLDYLSKLIRLNQIKLQNIFSIVGKSEPAWVSEHPFLFVLDASGKICDVFFPMKELPALSDKYYEAMFEKYFSN